MLHLSEPSRSVNGESHSNLAPTNLKTDSEDCFDLIQKWVKTCTQEHPICTKLRVKSSLADGWFPTRLLDLAFAGNADGGTLRLRHREDCLPDFQYATLSYCWGEKPTFTRLSKTNIEVYKQQGIETSSLPLTFQETIKVLRRINVRYLWIDALCIIQDSRTDWLREAVSMSSVYENASINISATASESAEGGLFRERNPDNLNGCVFALPADDPGHEYRCVPGDPWTESVVQSPLHRRSWTFQERLLSPRVVHFASSQIFWDCSELQACESYPRGDPWRSNAPYSPRLKKQFTEIRLAGSPEFNALGPDTHQFWSKVVEDYTVRALTIKTDKLIALSGVAEQLTQTLCQENYLAGLWRQNLAPSLLWYVDRGSTVSTSYRAPSWSWACIEGPVYMNTFSNDTVEIEVLTASTTTTGSLTGPVTAGSLQVRGLLCPIRFCPELKRSFIKHGIVQVGLDWCEYLSLDDPHPRINLVGSCIFFVWVTGDLPRGVKRESHHDKWRIRMVGLLLEPTGDVKGQFRRIGHWDIRRSRNPAMIVRRLFTYEKHDVLAEIFGRYCYNTVWKALHAGTIDAPFYQEFDGRNKYVIEII